MPSDRVLRAWYRQAGRDARRNEPGEPLISFREFKRVVRLQIRLENSDPGGDVTL